MVPARLLKISRLLTVRPWVLCKCLKFAIENYQSWIDATIIVEIFACSYQVHDVTSSYHINKQVIKSDYNIQCIDKNPIPFISLQGHDERNTSLCIPRHRRQNVRSNLYIWFCHLHFIWSKIVNLNNFYIQ